MCSFRERETFISFHACNSQDLERLEMVFDEGGGGLMKPVSEGTNFGVLPEPSVVLHAMNSSE